jgi:hypothetical protein
MRHFAFEQRLLARVNIYRTRCVGHELIPKPAVRLCGNSVSSANFVTRHKMKEMGEPQKNRVYQDILSTSSVILQKPSPNRQLLPGDVLSQSESKLTHATHRTINIQTKDHALQGTKIPRATSKGAE